MKYIAEIDDGYITCPYEDCRVVYKVYDNKNHQMVSGIACLKKVKAKGEWQITDSYPHNVYCSICHKKFAQTRWAVWEDGSLPRKYCPNCGAEMEFKDEHA